MEILLVNFKFLSLKKIFLLSLVQTAKSCHIKTQQNLEFLGEFDGGAKTTHQILVSYRWNTGRFEKDMPDMCPA